MAVSKVTIRYFGMLRDIVGKRSETLSIDDGSTTMDLLRRISSEHGKRFQDFVFESDGKIRSGLAFAINGISVDRSSITKTACKDVEEFVILPPISGGD